MPGPSPLGGLSQLPRLAHHPFSAFSRVWLSSVTRSARDAQEGAEAHRGGGAAGGSDTALSLANTQTAVAPGGGGGRSRVVRVHAVASYVLQRVKLSEVEKMVRWQPSTQKKWHITSDRDWTLFSLRPAAADGARAGDPASMKVGRRAVPCNHPAVRGGSVYCPACAGATLGRRVFSLPSPSLPPPPPHTPKTRCPGVMSLRQASHVAVSKRGPIVCVNCDQVHAGDVINAAHSSQGSTALKEGASTLERACVRVCFDAHRAGLNLNPIRCSLRSHQGRSGQ